MLKKYSSSKFLTIAPDALFSEVISLMNQNHASCVLIESQHQLQGIFTESDLVKLLASGTDFAQKTIAEVMTKKPIVLSTADNLTPSEIITLFQRHQIRHLPLVDAQSKVVGIITYNSLMQAINGDYFPRHRTVREAMQQQVVQTTGDRSITNIVQSEVPFISWLNTCPFLVWTSGTDGLCNFFNTAWLDFTGKTLEQELGTGWTEGVHPEDLDFCLSTYNTAFARREKFTMEYRLHKGNGEYGWIYDEGIPRFKADGSFAGYIGTCVDISDRIKAKQEREQLLRQIDQERQFLESVLQQMPAGVMIVQPPSGKIILFNDNVSAILRHQITSINNIEDYAKFGCLEADGNPKKVEDYPLIKAFSGETTQGLEIDYLCGDGVIRTLFTNTAPIRNHQSQIIAAIATFYDVTEQKQAQAAQKEAENKSILLKEIHHRIKNNLQIVSALLDLQTEQIQDRAAQILLEKSQARIQTMALIHEKLYNSQNLERVNFLEYVTSLSRYLYDSFIQDFKQIQITLDLEPTELSLDLATPCGLIINELVVNSLQHGFVNQATGEIKIKFKKYAESYYLCIQDNGSGSNLEFNTISNNTQFLGLSLVESLVEKQLKGTWKINQDHGFVIEITFPDL